MLRDKIFWKTFIAAATGKALATLGFAALLVVFGISTNDIIHWLVGGLVDPLTARWAAIIVGALGLLHIWVFAPFLARRSQRLAEATPTARGAVTRISRGDDTSISAVKIFAAERPNYAKWDKRDSFTLLETAWLWEDYEPGSYDMTDLVRARFHRLAVDARARKLRIYHGDDIKEVAWEALDQVQRNKVANPEWPVTREDAKAYARAIDERPKFLFPMERI